MRIGRAPVPEGYGADAAAAETGLIVTAEEHSANGGLGAAVAQTAARRIPVPMRMLGLPDEELIAGGSALVFAHYGLDARGIAASAREAAAKKPASDRPRKNRSRIGS